MRRSLEYTFGRLLAVGSRPLLLFLTNNYLAPGTAKILATAMLASSLATVSTAADPHRRFYERRFSPDGETAGTLFHVYVGSSAILLAIGLVGATAVVLRSVLSPAIVAAAALFFVSEKIGDEVLRMRLFESRFATWGRIVMARSVANFVALGLVFLIGRTGAQSAALVSLLGVGNLAVYLPQLPRSLWRPLRVGHWRTGWWLLRRGAVALRGYWMLWLLALMGATIGYVDRAVALLVDANRLPVFTLVVMCFSIVALSVDFFYVSRHRREFLQGTISAKGSVTNREFLACLFGGLALALVAVAFVLRLSRGGDTFPLLYVGGIAALQCSVAIAVIPREISYWTRDYRHILQVEVAFWLLFGTVVAATRHFGGGPAQVVLAGAACAFVRLLLHLKLAARLRGPGAAVPDASLAALDVP